MKKRIIVFLTLICLLLTSIPVSAQKTNTTTTIEYDEYGYCNITEITISETPNSLINLCAATQTKTGTKKTSYVDPSTGKTIYTVGVTGTFTYNGSSATCTNATSVLSYLSSGWDVTSRTARKSGNSAVANFTLSNGSRTRNQVVVLTCTATGTLK